MRPTGRTTSANPRSIPAPGKSPDEQSPNEQSTGKPHRRAQDQHRRSDWPVQLKLPGQAAAPDGPIELSGMFLMHHAFRRDLVAFTSAATRTPLGDRSTWKALSKRWGRFGKVLHKHHTAEDAGLWPLLLERVRRAGDA